MVLNTIWYLEESKTHTGVQLTLQGVLICCNGVQYSMDNKLILVVNIPWGSTFHTIQLYHNEICPVISEKQIFLISEQIIRPGSNVKFLIFKDHYL